MQRRGDENEPYEPGPYEQQPQDAVPAQYRQQPYPPQPYEQPQGYGYYPPPVTVNVVQNAGAHPVVMRKRVNHTLHFWLTIFTGGAWLFVWIPLAIKGKKTIVYR